MKKCYLLQVEIKWLAQHSMEKKIIGLFDVCSTLSI